jgi:phosphoglycerate dehydrogenase-like enzyme
VTKKAIVLDDYQGIARECADWDLLGGRVEVDFMTTHVHDELELAQLLGGYEIVVLMRERTPFPASLLARLPRLELLLTTGPFNAAVDLDAAAQRGVPVWATRGFLPPTTELTCALILACVKNVCGRDREVKAGGWQSGIGGDLHGARLGVVGLGYYGSEVARIGQAFGMEVVAWSQNLTAERCAEVSVKPASKEELLATSDVVSIHLVLSDRTRGLIAEDDLRRMKRSAYLVNTSRGPIVDEAALVHALQERWIAGAGLDVFEVEPLPSDSPLRTLDNVVTTPHVGYVTERSYRVFFEDVVENILCHLDGRPGRAIGASPHRSGPFLVPG